MFDKIRFLARLNGFVWLRDALKTYGVRLISELSDTAMRAILRDEAARLREAAANFHADEARMMRIDALELAAMAA